VVLDAYRRFWDHAALDQALVGELVETLR